MVANILSIAGSDPSGGAGVQADLKTIGACGGYGMAALTALTAQNTQGVQGVSLVEPAFVAHQIRAVFEDVRVDAVKIGMIATASIAHAVAETLGDLRAANVVLDPVMVATSGDRLLSDDAVAAVRDRLAPLARVITPNTDEAGVLLGEPRPTDRAGMADAGRRLLALGVEAVLLKGGHLTDDAASPDVLVTAQGVTWLDAPRAPGRVVHGGGCSFASALATGLGKGLSPEEAAVEAKAFITAAIEGADLLTVGSGSRPLDHFTAHRM
ncbi:MAG: bifunctional hydroxymethylpyrimidine kinase/phosphomethylpyrimidine kinase [Pseudomonadota bacterium]